MGSGVAVGSGVTEFSGVSVGSSKLAQALPVGSGTARVPAQSLVLEQKSALAYLWDLAPQWVPALQKAVPLYFACSSAILDASRILQKKCCTTYSVTPSVLCFSSILAVWIPMPY